MITIAPSKRPEQLLEGQRERLARARRPPDEPLALDAGKSSRGRPDLDRPFVAVHHPVERDAGLAIAQPLEEAVALGEEGLSTSATSSRVRMRLQVRVRASSGRTTKTSGWTSTSGPQEMSAGDVKTTPAGLRSR